VRISTPLNRRDAVSDEGVIPVGAMSRQGVATPLSRSGIGSVKLFRGQFRVIQPGNTAPAPAPTFWASLRAKGGTGRDGQDWTGLDLASSGHKGGPRTAAVHARIQGWTPSHTSQRNLNRARPSGESLAKQSIGSPRGHSRLFAHRAGGQAGRRVCLRAVLGVRCGYTHSLDDGLCSSVLGCLEIR
jgi:hypothetical protein